MMNDSQARALASRFIQLTPEKRSIFLDALAKEGISFSAFPIVPSVNEASRNELSYTQQRMWFLWQLDPQSAAYNLPIVTRLSGSLNVDILNKALNSIVARHEILRTCFPADEFGRPSQFICNTFEVSIEIEDLTYSSIDIQDEQVHVVVKQESLTPFDLINGPLLRVKLIKLSKLRHVLIMTLHHIVADGWSINVLIEELVRYYEAYSANNQPDLDPLPIQYADYALWQRTWLESGELQRQMAYWVRQLEGEQPVLELPTDYPKSSLRSSSGVRYEFEIDNHLAKDLRELARQKNASLFMVLLAAFKILLFRYTSAADIRVGIPIANRNKAETERLIGCFINTQVMRTQLDSQQTFFDLLERVRNTVIDAQAHQDLPFEKLVEALQPERSLIHNPLFQVMFNHQDQLTDVEELSVSSGLQLSNFLWEKQTTEFDLKLDTWQKKNSLHAGFTFASDLFERSTIERLAHHWQRILAEMVRDPSQRIAEIPLLDEIETHRILREWNATEMDYGEGTCIHSLFEVQMEKTPEAIALIFPQEGAEQRLTYTELNSWANRLAHRLRSLGVGPDVLVGIAVERSIEMVIGLLGILKAGGVYVPLDPEYPAERLSYMMTDSGIELLLTQERLQERLPIPQGVQVLNLGDQSEADWQQESDENLPLITLPGNLAYVIYTSGSTGKPKGVAVAHCGVINLLLSMARRLDIDTSDRVLGLTSLSFDIAALELYLPLINGAAIALLDSGASKDPQAIIEATKRTGTTLIQATPSTWKMLMDTGATALLSHCTLLTGGEVLPEVLAQDILQSTECLWNVYGPTETTIWSAIYRLDKTSREPYIGSPIDNTEIYILGGEFNPRPMGVVGELYIGGDGVVRGYYSKPGLTAERFVPDSYGEAGGRLYRTGDLARYRLDGNIEYIGRIDHQVKIRGFRIELGEIESQLQAQAEVRDAVVIAQLAAGGQQLVAYVVPSDSILVDKAVDADVQNAFRADIKAQLQAVLPEYMVPNQYVLLDKLPLTPNGKLDRKALPAVEGSVFQRVYEAPRMELEQQLASIWQEVLRVERVGLNDNFFELGGHSLLATQTISRIRQSLATDLPLRALFETSDLRALAERVSQERSIQLALIERVSREQPLLLSYAQQRQWVLWQLEPDSSAYHISAALRLKGAVDVKALGNSFDAVIARHEVLRTHIAEQDGELYQVILPTLSLPISPQVLEIIEGETKEQALERMLQNQANEPFNLTEGPLLRARLIYLGDNDQVLSLIQHHIISDAWSMRLMVEELVIAYQAYSQNRLPVLPELPIQYADYAVWQRAWMEAGEGERQLSYWRQQLGDEQPVLELPLDRPRPQQPSYRGASLSQMLSSELALNIEQQARAAGVTPFMFLLASFQILLHRYSGQEDIRVGVPIANRTRLETERLIGFFVNTQVLRAEIGLETTINDLLQQTRQRALEAQAHQDLPFEQLVEALQSERSLNTTPLFQVMFNYHDERDNGTGRQLEQLGDLIIEPVGWEQQSSKFDLTLTVMSAPEGFIASFNYSTDLFERETIERLSQHWQRILETMVNDPLQRISELPMLSQDETHRILREWNATEVDYGEGGCIHSLFEAQVERIPEATALIFLAQADQPKQTLTYAQLNAKANQLAHTLRKMGVGSDVLAGIAVERSIEMVIGLLGILKAGGAYVPLDPEYPAERLNYMMTDSGIQLLLTQTSLHKTLLVPSDVKVLCLDQAETWQQDDTTNLSLVTNPKNLAYVIYTSGTTGKAKGVAVSHGALCNYLKGVDDKLGLPTSGNFAMISTFAADLGNTMFYGALCGGRTLHLIPKNTVLDAEQFTNYMEHHAIGVLKIVPSHLQALLQAHNSAASLPSQCLILGGEACSQSLVQRVRALRPDCRIVNHYGPTETTIGVLIHEVKDIGIVALGKPLANSRAYIVDQAVNLVLTNVNGELLISGTGLAQGYYGRPALTAEKFVPDPYDGQGGGRLYRTGDLARYRSDGNIEYIGRIDHQVKIRGFRIELGEIESQLQAQAGIQDAVVIAQSATGGQRLVAYVIPSDSTLADEAVDADVQNIFRADIKAQLQAVLPEYMVPNQYVLLDKLPLTPNGKLDRKALPTVEVGAFTREYQVPRTELEQQLASIWQEVLGVEQIGLNDNFFELGGHSLLSIQLLNHVRRQGWVASVRDLFQHPQLGDFAKVLEQSSDRTELIVPPNRIPEDCQSLTPEMVTLVDLQSEELASIEAMVPGGAANIQDIYPLAPLQEGILFHHLLQTEGDVYITSHTLRFDTRKRLEHFIRSFNQVIARHDILRTAVLWENLKEPVQIVYRQAELPVQWLELDGESPVIVQLDSRTESAHYRIDVRQAPMLRLIAAYDIKQECWLVKLLSHHLIDDNTTLQRVVNEIALIQKGREQELPEPLPFRHFIAQYRMAMSNTDHQDFFTRMLGDVDEPTVPFNLQEVRGDGTEIDEAVLSLSEELVAQVRQQAQKYGVSTAAIFHLAWALVVGKTSSRSDVVFGTVLLGRMSGGEGAERALGLFINTLPVRIQLGQQGVAQSLLQTHRILSELMEHEQASLGLAMRCSALSAGTPLFSALLNYRHTRQLKNGAASDTVEGIEVLEGKERTNYPFGISVDDDGKGFGLVAHVQASIGAERICEMMHIATAHVVEALANKPDQFCCELNLLSQVEQDQLQLWSASSLCCVDAESVHCLFEAQVEKTPEAIALIFPQEGTEQRLTYAELNSRANRLAHRLRSLGVGPDVLVGIAVERSIEMVVAVLAVLKAGGAYVPLDPEYPADRLAYMASNSRLTLLITQKSINGKLPLSDDIQRVFLEDNYSNYPLDNLSISIHDKNLAYVIFTSGTTGLPKGVGIDQGSLARHTKIYANRLALTDTDCVLQYATLNFDTFGEQVFPSLCRGACVVVRGGEIWDHDTFYNNLIHYGISVANLTPSLWFHLIKDFAMQGREDFGCLHRMIVGGEALPPEALIIWQQLGLFQSAELWNFYGPTEATAAATSFCCNVLYKGNKPIPPTIPIGEPLQGRTVYIVSNDFNLLPSGVVGELVIGGELLARGYLGRAGLTAERFVPDSYGEAGGRLYRTGDLARYRSDGNIEYVGRIDHQVKIRGFRIELGEIESQLQAQVEVRDAVVIVQSAAGGPQLVAYVVPVRKSVVEADAETQNTFRSELKSRLQMALPEYMVPAQYVLLVKLPLTPNGKLDRKALPTVEGNAFIREYQAPRTGLEQQLAEIWQSVLGVEQVGLNDNFFELGGDSIISIQLVSRARQKGIHFTPKDVFQYQTLASLSAVAKEVEEVVQIDQGLVKGTLQLIPIQQWFFEEMIPQRYHWNQSVLLKPFEPLQSEVLQMALEHLLYHHDALRLSFTERKDQGWQAVFLAPEQANKDLLWQVSVSGVEELETSCNETQRSLDLERGPLLRAVLIDLPEGEQRLLLVIHHLVVDGVSWRILLEDFQNIYQQIRSGQVIQLPGKTSSVQVWSERLQQYARSEALQRELGYWQKELAEVQENLPQDNPKGSLQNKFAQSVTTHLDRAWTERLLKEAPTTYRTQINDLLLTALARVIARWTQQSSVLIQLEGHGREDLFEDIDLTRTVGWFTTVYPVRLSPSDSLDISLKTIKEQLQEVPNKGIGFGVLRYLGNETTRQQLKEFPQPRITFNYLGQFDSSFDTEKGLFSPVGEPSGAGQSPEAPLGNWLSINGQVYNGELNLNWTFSSEMYAEATIQKLADAYTTELQTLIEYCCRKENCAITPSDFPLVNLTQAQLDALPIPAAEIEDIYPLSPMQKGMLFHTLSAPEERAYVNQLRVDIRGLDIERFCKAWQATLDRHAILRAGFIWEEVDEPVQVIRRHQEIAFQELDWRGHSNLDKELVAWAQYDRQKGFDLTKEPKLRLTAIRVDDTRHHFIYTNHHILMDGWSGSQLMGEVLQRYQGQIPAIILGSYRDYLAWLQSRDVVESERFWREQLAELEEPTLLACVVGNAVRTQSIELNETEAVWGDYTEALTAGETSRLSNFARQQKVTVNTVLQAAWLLLLQRYTGQDCVTFGATVAGRPAEVSGIEQQLGLFINTLPVVGRIDPAESVGDWLQRVQTQNLALREHEHTPLYEIQRWVGQGGNALFDNIIVFENYPISEALKKDTLSGLVFGEVQNYEQTNYGLTLAVNVSDHLSLQCHYDRRQFSDVIVKQLGQQLICLLATFMQNVNQAVGNLPLLNLSDTTYLYTPNRASRAYPLRNGYAPLFEEQVEHHSGKVVARCKKEEWTYSQLNQKANRLAHELIAQGVLPDTPVALLAERGLPLLGMVNGVFKAAAGYLPLDPVHPIKRLVSIIESSATRVLVCNEQSRSLAQKIGNLLPKDKQPKILIWEDIQKNQDRIDNPNLKVIEQHLAYVIYTSGSTGEPKGVMVEQAGMLNNQLSKIPYLELTESDVIAQTASQVFDISVWQFLTAGLCGARVEIVPDEVSRDPDALLKYVSETGITILESVPALISGMLTGAFVEVPNLRYLLPTGEAMPPKLARQWMERYPEIKLVNAYGPAECSDDVALHRVELVDTQGTYLPIGEATDNNGLFILNSALSMMPWQVTGELYIAGTGVGRGYLANPVRTAETFVPNEFAEQPGERLYRSGDLVRRRYPDGMIEYIGRLDHQVKIRGFRIELGEIESQLNVQAEVKEAVVIAQQMGETGGQQLVAYMVPSDSALVDDAVDADVQNAFRANVKAQLQVALPEYMIPNQYVLLDKLPLTPNGKLDRKALPKVDGSSFTREYQAPQTELERQLAEVWQSVLGVEQVGLNDNFFELGGDSIVSIQLVSRARQRGIYFAPKDVFQYQTLASLSIVAREIDKEATRIDQGPVKGSLQLTPIQQWFFEEMIPQRHQWNLSALLKLSKPLQASVLQAAMEYLLYHHDALRLSFSEEKGRGWQAIFLAPEQANKDLLWHTSVSGAEELEVLCNETQRSLDLERGPLLRAVLVDLPDGEQRLLLVIHHLVVDGVSWRILLEDLQTACRQLLDNQPISLQAKASSVQTWSERLQQYVQSEALQQELGYWQKELAEVQENLLRDNPEGSLQNKFAQSITTHLDKVWTERLLKEAPVAYHTQINDLLLTALARVIARWTQQSSVLIQLEGHGREDLFEDIDLTRTVGWFTSMYPVRLSSTESLDTSIQTIKEQLRVVPNKGIGFGVLRYLSDEIIQQQLRELPIPRITFNYLGQFDNSFDAEEGLFNPSGESSGIGRDPKAPLGNWLTINGQVYNGELNLNWTFSSEMYAEATIQKLADAYAAELRTLIEHCCKQENYAVNYPEF